MARTTPIDLLAQLIHDIEIQYLNDDKRIFEKSDYELNLEQKKESEE